MIVVANIEHFSINKMSADDLGYLPSEPLLKHWKEIAPRKVFFLYAVGAYVPLKAIIGSEILENITCFEPDAPQPTRCLDWFAPEVGYLAATCRRYGSTLICRDPNICLQLCTLDVSHSLLQPYGSILR
jgi:hypothetical protein